MSASEVRDDAGPCPLSGVTLALTMSADWHDKGWRIRGKPALFLWHAHCNG